MINQYMEAAPSPFQVVFPNLESLHHPPLNANGSTTKKASGWLLLPYATRTMFSHMLRVKIAFNFHENHSFQWNPEVRFQPSKSVLCLPSGSHCSRGLSFDSPAIKPIFAYQTSFFVRTKFIMSIFHLKHITPTKKKPAFRRDQNHPDFPSIPQVQMGHRCSSRLGC